MAGTWNLNPIQRKVRSARLRHLVGLILEQTVIAMAIVLAVRIIFAVRPAFAHKDLWIELAGVLVAVMGALQVKRRLHSPYEIAQTLDTRAGLRDLFSTAWFLLEHPDRAAGPNVAAHITQANAVLSEIRLIDSFPFPLRNVLAIAGLTALFVATVSVFPGAARQGRSLTVANHLKSLSSAPGKAEEARGLAGGEPAADAASQNPDGRQQARMTNGVIGAASPDMDTGDSQADENLNGAARNTNQSAVDQGTAENGQTRGANESGTRKTDAGKSKELLPSRVLSSIRRLLDGGRQPAKADMQPESAASNKGNGDPAHRAEAAPGATPREQQGSSPGKTEYVSAGASAQQTPDKTPASSPTSIGASHAEAALRSPDSFPMAMNVIELADASPDGETGHTKVQAVHSAVSHERMHSAALDHHAGSGRGVTRDDVPFGYQRSIQAYFARTENTAPK